MKFKLNGLAISTFIFLLSLNTITHAEEKQTYTVLYTAPNNHTYFKQETKALYPFSIGTRTLPIRVKEVTFGNAPSGEQTWHNTPKRMFIFIMSGVMQMQSSCGQVRNFKAGDIVLLEDLGGRGHITRTLDSKPVNYLMLSL